MLTIFIEGCDNTGKTTLAKALAEEFNLEYTHCQKPKTSNPYLEYKLMIDSIQKDSVFDRGYLGEYVYSQLWRGGCNITLEQFEDLDQQCIWKIDNVFLIHATAPIEVIKQRCIEQNEELLKLDEVEKCAELFDFITGFTSLPKIQYDSNSQTPQDIIKIIKDLIKK